MKKCIFLLLTLLSFPLLARAWNPYLMNHERFVHLSQPEKETVIIRTMELMVEMESKYQLLVQTPGHDSEKLKKIVKVLNQLRQFIISDVVAADFADMGKQFANLLADPKLKDKKGNSLLCIYGGWISQIVTLQNGTKYCIHPAKASYQKIRDAYKAVKNTCTSTQISCNPMVFGYKKAEGQKLFCVATGSVTDQQNKSHNVAYECMRASLKVEGSATQDSKDVRLATMTKAIEGNPDAFNTVHKFIFRTCACAEGEMSKFYKEYIRPHRTCYGMMNSLNAMNYSECAAVGKMPDADFATEWTSFFSDPKNIGEKSVPYSRLPNDDDADYKNLIMSESMAKYCAGDGPQVVEVKDNVDDDLIEIDAKYACKADCSASGTALDGKNKYTCKVTESKWETAEGKITEAKLKVSEFKDVLAGTADLEVEIQKDDGAIVKEKCPITLKEENKTVAKSCSITVSDSADDKNKSVAVLSFQGYSEKEIPEDIKWSSEGLADAKDPNTKTFDKTDAEQVIKVNYKMKGEASQEGLSCEGKIPAKGAATDEKKYTIDAVSADPSTADASTMDVKAIVTIDGVETQELGDLKISWTLKGDAAPKVTTVKTEEDDSKIVKDEIPLGNGEAVIPTETDLQVPDGEVGTGPTFTATRGEKVYEACATLLDKTGKELAQDCDNIPLLSKSHPNLNNTNNRPNFPMNNQRQQNFNAPKNTAFGGVK